MKSISYTSFIVSITLLYWCTATAYNRVIRVDQLEVVPIFHKQKCVVTHLDFHQEKSLVDDLNIYYSGTKPTDDLPQKPIINQEDKIQEEILKIVKDKQVNQPEVVVQPKIQQPKVEKEKTVEKVKVQPKINIQKKSDSDDAFSMKKKPDNIKKTQPKKNVFDVIE
jgi:hypothetical protein